MSDYNDNNIFDDVKDVVVTSLLVVIATVAYVLLFGLAAALCNAISSETINEQIGRWFGKTHKSDR